MWGGVFYSFTNAHRGSQLPSTAEIRMFFQSTLKRAAVKISYIKHNSKGSPLLAEEAHGACIMAAQAANNSQG